MAKAEPQRKSVTLGNVPPLEAESTLAHILHNDAFSAVMLLGCAVAAFAAANVTALVMGVPVYEWYAGLWEMYFGLSIGNVEFVKPLHIWINDGLMSIFFFVVGLEIKRELLIGELSSLRKATLPIVAAIGGMVAPALFFTLFNLGGEGAQGWGIPMATDIAFSVGVLGLFSSRIPSTLAVFLIALAIVDDMGAVIVIALFYTESLDVVPLEVGIGLILLSMFFVRLGVRNAFVFMLLFAIIWFAFLESGVHATIAGVLFALTIPVDARYSRPLFISRINALMRRFHEAEDQSNDRLVNAQQQRIIRAIEQECIHVEAPLQRIENKLHPFAALVIMPIFAFANSGVHLEFSQIGSLLVQPVTLGVIAGLVLGKQVGIMFACWLAVKAGIADLPGGVSWRLLWALSWLAGIGFTMSLFIAGLAFGGGHGHEVAAGGSAHLAEAKVGIIAASLIAGTVGSLLLYLFTRNARPEPILTH